MADEKKEKKEPEIKNEDKKPQKFEVEKKEISKSNVVIKENKEQPEAVKVDNAEPKGKKHENTKTPARLTRASEAGGRKHENKEEDKKAKLDKKEDKDKKDKKKENKEDPVPTAQNQDSGLSVGGKIDFIEDEKKFDNDDLPEEIKKKLEKKKIEKSRKKQARRKKKKEIKKVKKGKAYIKATYNNTIVTLTDLNGNVISWASAGVAGFKGPKKATPYAAQIITKIACIKAKEEFGLEEVDVFIKGVGTGRESAVRALNANGLIVTLIKDITPIPHNGCRARRPRRV